MYYHFLQNGVTTYRFQYILDSLECLDIPRYTSILDIIVEFNDFNFYLKPQHILTYILYQHF